MPKQSAALPRCENTSCINEFLFGRYCERCAKFDVKKFSANRYPAIFLSFSLMQRHFKALYQLCAGDMVMGLVFCEIWQYNLSRYFARAGVANAEAVLGDADTRHASLPACNTYSISQSLGAPSETVRRKVQKLVAMGLIIRNGGGELIATNVVDDVLFSAEAESFMRSFISTSRHVMTLVDGEQHAPACFQQMDTSA